MLGVRAARHAGQTRGRGELTGRGQGHYNRFWDLQLSVWGCPARTVGLLTKGPARQTSESWVQIDGGVGPESGWPRRAQR